jgi:hypothetical protein
MTLPPGQYILPGLLTSETPNTVMFAVFGIELK